MSEDATTRHVRLSETSRNATQLRTHYYDKSWGLVIGINDYQEEHPTLANARNDAVAFANLLRANYQFEEVITLYDAEATCDTLMAWLRDRLPSQIGKNDRLVIFFAGHGTTRESGLGEKRGYLIPHDAKAGRYADYIDMSELRDACGWISAKHILLILDCCFSGVAAITARAAPTAEQRVITDAYLQEITRRSAWQVLTAGASDELAADSGDRPGHSAFTSALLAGLEGQADQNSDGIITASELAGFVKPAVSRQGIGPRAHRQTPFFNYLSGSEQGDFVFLRHDTEIKIAPSAGTAQRLVEATKSSPLLMALIAILFVAVGLLAWYVGNLPANPIDPIAVQQTVDAKLAPTLTWIAAQSAPTQLAAGATVTAEAPQVATEVVATNEVIGAAPSSTATLTPIPTTTRTPVPSARGAVALLYDAQAGDTWASIAQRYQMTESELRGYNAAWFECVNGLNTACRTEPKAGDDILIPSLAGETLIGRGTTYTIKAGEGLFRVAVRTGYTVSALADANQAKVPDPNMIRTGTALYIPQPAELASLTSCQPVADPPLQMGDQGKICLAKGSDLGLRDGAGDSRTITRLQNGTLFTVVGGPECAYYSYAKRAYFWWQVETSNGQSGWLVDGSDTNGDPVYLCRIAAAAPTVDSTSTVTDIDETAQRISSAVVQAITAYWSRWGQAENCGAAWDTLSDSFKRNTSGLNADTYLADCARTRVQVTRVLDLDPRSESVVEMRGQCALVRIQFTYSGPQEMTFGLIQSASAGNSWQIQVVRADHNEAQLRADDVCG